MISTFSNLTQEIQDRIREIAYLMWESAGRQHGMAMEYWLAAEQEVVATLQAAAHRIIPEAATAAAKPTAIEALPKSVAFSSEPPTPESRASAEAAAIITAAPASQSSSSTSAPASENAATPARRPTTRRKVKA